MSKPAHKKLTDAIKLINADKPLDCLHLLETIEAEFTGVSAFYTLRGTALARLHEHDLAVKHFTEAIKLDPLDPLPYVSIGLSLSSNLQHDEAEKYFELALVLDPDQAEALSGIGQAAFHRLDYAKAEHYFLEALKRVPNNAGILSNLGGCYLVQGVYDKAMKYLNKAIAQNSDDQVARTNRGLLKLGMGEFTTAWDDYEYRWTSAHLMAKRFQNLKEWEGPSGPETAVLIWAEQGLGDEIMFASVFPELEKLKQKFIIECDARLFNIFRTSFPKLTFVPRNTITDTGPIEYQLPLASLGRLFRRSKQSFTRYPHGYLKLGEEPLPEESLEVLQKLPRPWIGVSWESYALIKNFRGRKSISADEFSIFTRVSGASYINLQFPNPHKHEREKGAVQEIPDNVVTLPGLNLKNDISRLASLICQLDHVVTIGNSVAHICGAFGVPTTVLLPSASDWRWGHRGDKSVWYASLELVRNPDPDSWKGLLEQLASKTETFVQTLGRD